MSDLKITYDEQLTMKLITSIEDFHKPVAEEGTQACICIQGAAACGVFRDYKDCLSHAEFLNPNLKDPGEKELKWMKDMIKEKGLGFERDISEDRFELTTEIDEHRWGFKVFSYNEKGEALPGKWVSAETEELALRDALLEFYQINPYKIEIEKGS